MEDFRMFPEENIFSKKCFSISLIYLNRKLVPRKQVPWKATMTVLTVHEHPPGLPLAQGPTIPRLPAPAPARPQQGQAPAPWSPALPGHGPHQLGPHPSLALSCPYSPGGAWCWGCPCSPTALLLAGMVGRVLVPGPALTAPGNCSQPHPKEPSTPWCFTGPLISSKTYL